MEMDDEPRTYQEAMKTKDSKKWLEAMNEEMLSLQKNETSILVNKPKDKKLVGSKWIFKRKEGIPGVEKARYKAQLVPKGLHRKREWIIQKFFPL